MRCFVLTIALAVSVMPVAAQTPGAFLFSYRPHDGRRAAFEEGYRTHLEWHRTNRDSLTWLAWDVIAGPRLGQFVDGIFGVSFAALDVRVDPAGDARDAAVNVEAHAEPTAREMLRLRRDLSSLPLLEDDRPGPLIQVVRFSGCASCHRWLEQAFERLHRGRVRQPFAPWALYESIAGGRPGFLLMVWRERWASFEDAVTDPARAVLEHLAEIAPGADVRVSSEIWRYRGDLTYRPADRR